MIADNRNSKGVELCSLLSVKGLRRPPEGDTSLLIEIVILQAADSRIDMDKTADDPVDTIQVVFNELVFSYRHLPD